MVWDGIVAVDLFFAGMGALAFIFAVLFSWDGERGQKTKKFAMIAAFVCVALGAIILAVDAKAGIQHPLRFIHLFSNFGSVMTWGVVFISVFLLISFISIVLQMMKKKSPKWLELIGCLFALGVAGYTGVLLGSSQSYPLWNMMILPVAFFVSAAYCGLALTGIIGFFVEREELAAKKWLSPLCLALPVLQALCVCVLLGVTAASTGVAQAAGSASVSMLISGEWAVLFWAGLVVIGIVAPLVLEFMNRAALKKGEAKTWVLPAEFVCIMIGGFVLRFLVVMAAVPLIA